MKLPVDRKRTLITFVIADLIFAVLLFLSCINLFFFQKFGAVQIVIIALFVFISIFMLVLGLVRNFYVSEPKTLVVFKGTRVMYYDYSDVVYIDEEASQRKKTVIFCTNKGHVRYLPFDKDGKIYDIMVSKCKNRLELDAFRIKYPNVKI